MPEHHLNSTSSTATIIAKGSTTLSNMVFKQSSNRRIVEDFEALNDAHGGPGNRHCVSPMGVSDLRMLWWRFEERGMDTSGCAAHRHGELLNLCLISRES